MFNKSKFNLFEYAYYTFTKFYMKYESKGEFKIIKLLELILLVS